MEGLERIVLEHPFFSGLGAEFGAAISGCAHNLRFAAGERPDSGTQEQKGRSDKHQSMEAAAPEKSLGQAGR